MIDVYLKYVQQNNKLVYVRVTIPVRVLSLVHYYFRTMQQKYFTVLINIFEHF